MTHARAHMVQFIPGLPAGDNNTAAIIHVSFKECKHLPTECYYGHKKDHVIFCTGVLTFEKYYKYMRPTLCVSFKECKHPPSMYGFVHVNNS